MTLKMMQMATTHAHVSMRRDRESLRWKMLFNLCVLTPAVPLLRPAVSRANGRPQMLTTDGATADTVGRAEPFKGSIVKSCRDARRGAVTTLGACITPWGAPRPIYFKGEVEEARPGCVSLRRSDVVQLSIDAATTMAMGLSPCKL